VKKCSTSFPVGNQVDDLPWLRVFPKLQGIDFGKISDHFKIFIFPQKKFNSLKCDILGVQASPGARRHAIRREITLSFSRNYQNIQEIPIIYENLKI